MPEFLSINSQIQIKTSKLPSVCTAGRIIRLDFDQDTAIICIFDTKEEAEVAVQKFADLHQKVVPDIVADKPPPPPNKTNLTIFVDN